MNRRMFYLVLLVLLSSLVFAGCRSAFSCEVVYDEAEIPDNILTAAKRHVWLEGERGYYVFSNREYQKDHELYFLVCGGDAFPDKYDIKIESCSVVEQRRELKGFDYTTYQISFSEGSTGDMPSYSLDSVYDYPFIICRITQQSKSKMYLHDIFHIDENNHEKKLENRLMRRIPASEWMKKP